MAIESMWTQVQHTPLTLVGLGFSAVLRAAIFISNQLIFLNLACQLAFFVRFHFNYLFHMTGFKAALAIIMTKLATVHRQLTTVYCCVGLTLSGLPAFCFFFL